MKTNAIISALCVVGILGALCSNGEEKQSVIETRARPEVTPIQVQKVVYWSDIPGMKWNWTTQVTNKPTFATVATSGSYNDLNNKPTLADVATSGSYTDLIHTPTIPTVGTLNSTLTTAQETSANESLSGTIKLHKVSKTGKLEDLSGASLTIGNVDTKYVKIKQTGEIEVFDDFGDSVVYTLNLPDKNGHLAVLSDIPSTNGLAAKSWVNTHQWAWSSISNKPSFATVATSGSYNDLSDKPTIPSASDFVQKSGDTMTGNLTIDPANESINPFIKIFNSDSMSSAYKMLTPQGLVSGYNNGGSQDTYTITFQDKSGTMALNEDVIAIIPAWTRSSTVSYTAGDLVRYNNKLYKAKQNIAANAAWNASNWEEVTIASELRSKMDKQVGADADSIAIFDSNGNAVDSGVNLTAVINNFNRYSLTNHVHNSITTLEPEIQYGAYATLTIERNGDAVVVCESLPTSEQQQPETWTNTLAFVNHTHSNLVNGSTKVVANENGTMTISKGDGSSVYYSVTGTYDQYNPRAIAQTDLSGYSEFSPSVSYTTSSDPVLYNGAVYGCLTTHTGPWDESHFRLLVPADKAGFHVRITTATSLGSLEQNQTTTAHIDVVWFLPLVGGDTQWQEHILISYDATVQYYGTDSDGKKTFGVYNQSNVVYGEDYNGSSSGLGGVAMLTSNTYYIMDYSPGGINRIDFVGGPIGWGDARFGWSDYLVADESFTKTVATVDQISSLDNKMDKVFNPTAGHIVTVTATGSLTDFGESPWGIRGDWNETDQSDVNYILNKPTNVSAFNNDAGYVKTNAVGSLVLGPSSANQASRAYTIVAGTGGANNESDNSIIIGPGSHIYQNSDYSGIFGPGGSIKAGSSYSFVFGASTVEAGCPNSFVIGSSATSTNACSFLWTADSLGNKTLPAAKITHGDGTFNINTLDGVTGVYIGDTNLQQIIRLEAKAMIHDAVSGVNVNLQSAEDTRAALTNLITILKNL